MVLDRFSGAAVALAMGLMLMAWPFGIGVALLVLPMLGADWRAGLWLSAGFCGLAFLLLAVAVRGAAPTAPSRRRMWLLPQEWRPLLALGVVWAGYNAAFRGSGGLLRPPSWSPRLQPCRGRRLPADRHLHPAPAAHGVPIAERLGRRCSPPCCAPRQGRGAARRPRARRPAHPAGLRPAGRTASSLIMPRRVRVRESRASHGLH